MSVFGVENMRSQKYGSQFIVVHYSGVQRHSVYCLSQDSSITTHLHTHRMWDTISAIDFMDDIIITQQMSRLCNCKRIDLKLQRLFVLFLF